MAQREEPGGGLTDDTGERRYVTTKELAQHLPFTYGTLRHKISRGEIPCIRCPGSQVLFDLRAIDAWLQQHAVPANES